MAEKQHRKYIPLLFFIGILIIISLVTVSFLLRKETVNYTIYGDQLLFQDGEYYLFNNEADMAVFMESKGNHNYRTTTDYVHQLVILEDANVLLEEPVEQYRKKFTFEDSVEDCEFTMVIDRIEEPFRPKKFYSKIVGFVGYYIDYSVDKYIYSNGDDGFYFLKLNIEDVYRDAMTYEEMMKKALMNETSQSGSVE